MRNPGQTLKIFLVDGIASGLRIIEKSNWVGKALACSRSQLSKVKDRPEFKKTGVYIIYSHDAGDVIPTIYIGEGDPVLRRLEAHDRDKDFWEHLILINSKDEALNKAHIQYLESRLVEMATEAKKCKLENGNSPTLPALSESDIADMESFLENMILIYSVLGIAVFETPKIKKNNEASDSFLYLKASNSDATGFESSDGFVVLKGAKASLTEVPSIHQSLKDFRAWMIADGLLKKTVDGYILTQDYTFTSPSKAAGVLLGRSSNGRVEWKDHRGKTLKDIQENIS